MRNSTEKDKMETQMSHFYVKKPSTPHIMDSQVDLTQEEYERRLFVEEQLTSLGISTSVFDANKDGHEDKDILEAIIIANRGEEIPEDLKVRIQRKHLLEQRGVAYPVIFTETDTNILIEVPDLGILTEANDEAKKKGGMAEAILMARDAIGITCIEAEDNGEKPKEATPISQIDASKGTFEFLK